MTDLPRALRGKEALLSWADSCEARAKQLERVLALRERGWKVLSKAERLEVARAQCRGYEQCDFLKTSCRRCRREAEAGDMAWVYAEACVAHRDAIDIRQWAEERYPNE